MAGLLAGASPAWAYVEAPFSLGKLIADSTNVLVIRLETVDTKANNLVYRKVRDIKGTHGGEIIKHTIGQGGFHPREWQTVMAWARVGEVAVLFHNGGAGEVCIANYWYQVYAGDWWRLSHGEPYLLRSFAGRPEKLATAVAAILTGQEVLVPCLTDGDKNALQLARGRVQRLRASLKLQDYNPKRDFAGWGVEEFTVVSDMPGFTHYSPLPKLGPAVRGVAPQDFDGDGKMDVCLYGESRLALLQNAAGSLTEVALGASAARWAGWADFDRDGNSDLLLAGPFGPRLLRNRKTQFDDLSGSIPRREYSAVTAGAWIDFDVDGRPDILLSDAFGGLVLFRNKVEDPPEAVKPHKSPPRGPPRPRPGEPAEPSWGPWYVVGPFDNVEGRGFDAVYPPEKEVNLTAQHRGKGGQQVGWRKAEFQDGAVNNLLPLVREPDNSTVYVYREMTFPMPTELPVSFGSDDTLTVWLNGQKIVAQNEHRRCAPDQALATLRFKQGRNRLLLKITNGGSEFAFYFAPKGPAVGATECFQNVTAKAGAALAGIAARGRVEHLLVADFDGDKRPDVLCSLAGPSGRPIVLRNQPDGFAEAPDSGLSYDAGAGRPAMGDFDGDGKLDLVVPQRDRLRLFRGLGGGRFEDVTARSAALAGPVPGVACAAWCDLDRRGRLDLLVGCLKAPNRFYRNNGDGTFSDATDRLGLWRRIFNTAALAAVDVNGDGVPDVVFANENRESAVLLGSPIRPSGK